MPSFGLCACRALKSARPQEATAPERQFLRTAYLDSPKGRLRKASLPCVRICRFRGDAQLWSGGFGGGIAYKKSPAILKDCRAFCAHQTQNRRSKPIVSRGNAPDTQVTFFQKGCRPSPVQKGGGAPGPGHSFLVKRAASHSASAPAESFAAK